MNNYKDFTYIELHEGKILANFPNVGEMLFSSYDEFKAYVDGYLITKKFFGEIEKELRNAQNDYSLKKDAEWQSFRGF